MYSQIISVSTEQGETKRTPFTEKEVEALWKISDQKNCRYCINLYLHRIQINGIVKYDM